MLDSNLRIRRFTSAAQKVLNLIPTDVGRPIGDIKPNIQVADLPRLIQDAITGGYASRAERSGFGRAFVCHEDPAFPHAGWQRSKAPFWPLPISTHCCAARRSARAWRPALRSLLTEPPDLLLAVSPEGQPLFVSHAVLADVRCRRSIRSSNIWRRRTGSRCGVVCVRRLETRSPAEIKVRKFQRSPRQEARCSPDRGAHRHHRGCSGFRRQRAAPASAPRKSDCARRRGSQ